MSKKHFIELANTMRETRPIASEDSDRFKQWMKDVIALADFCARQNSNFKRDRWLGFINGQNGPNGGTTK